MEHDLHAGHRQHGPHCDGEQPVALLSASDSNVYSQPFGIGVCVCAVRCFYCHSTNLTSDLPVPGAQPVERADAAAPELVLVGAILYESYATALAYELFVYCMSLVSSFCTLLVRAASAAQR